MADGTCGADVFAAAAEDDAVVGVDGGLFFAVFGFGFEALSVAEFDAFAAGCAFGGVYFWVPGDLVAGDSLVLGFWHVVSLQR